MKKSKKTINKKTTSLKKKILKSSKRKLAKEDIIDFCLYLHMGIKAGLGVADTLSRMEPYMRGPIKTAIPRAIRQIVLGAPYKEAILNLATQLPDKTFKRIAGILLFSLETGADIPFYLENIIHEINRG